MALKVWMKFQSVFILIISTLKAQTGKNCFYKFCSIPGQVRIDASFDIYGNFQGGCYCACDPRLNDPFSLNYCPEPYTINFDPVTMIGDCACMPPITTTTTMPPSTTTTTLAHNTLPRNTLPHNTPSTTTTMIPSLKCPNLFHSACSIGQTRVDPIYDAFGNFLGGCNCGCASSLSDPHSANYCAPPHVVNFDPVQFVGDCSCVLPTETTVNVAPTAPISTISPNAHLDPPALVEVLCDIPGICECPVGHNGDCNIICDGTDVCVEHPINCNNDGYACTVNCLSETACEGATTINGPKGGSLTVYCSGEFACEGGTVFNGDQGVDLTVMCHGTSSCTDALFNFGSGRGAIGCHGDPDACAGAEFNLLPNAVATAGISFTCLGLFCPSNAPAAFSNTLGNITKTCTNPGDCSCPPATKGKCTIICESNPEACADALIECNNDGYPCIVHCNGAASCSGASVIMGPSDASLTVYCKGENACEGETSFHAESGTDLSVICGGNHACGGDVQLNFGQGAGLIECIGRADACQGSMAFNLPRNAAITPGVSFECVGRLCPLHAPAAFNNVLHLSSGPEIHGFCCVPSVSGLVQWQGICWKDKDEGSCNAEPNGRCVWDITRCLPSVPTCSMAHVACTEHIDCCSEICMLSGPNSTGECL